MFTIRVYFTLLITLMFSRKQRSDYKCKHGRESVGSQVWVNFLMTKIAFDMKPIVETNICHIQILLHPEYLNNFFFELMAQNTI